MIGIYKITNTINNKCYIGQSVNIERRGNQHRRSINDVTCQNYPLYQAMRKYGIANFKFEIIEECARQELNNREKYGIQFYHSWGDGYNQTPGGDTGTGGKITGAILNQLIDDLRSTTLTQKQLATKYQISEEMVQGINTGRYGYADDIDYPIRKDKYNYFYRTGEKTQYYCKMCHCPVSKYSEYCAECSHFLLRKVEGPDPTTLAIDIVNSSFSATGRKYKVTDNTIRRGCKYYGLPVKMEELYDYVSHIKPDALPERKRKTKVIKKPVGQFQNDVLIAKFESTRDATHNTGIHHIKEVCDGKRVSAGGFSGRYLE